EVAQPAPRPVAEPPAEPPAEPAAAPAAARSLDLGEILAAAPAAQPAPVEPLPTRAQTQPASDPRPRRAAAPRRFEPSPFDALLAKAWAWLTTGNVPVKVGVILSLLGVGFLVKEGIDRQLLVLPLELRLMFVALFGIGLLVLGWRLRTKQRAYALS